MKEDKGNKWRLSQMFQQAASAPASPLPSSASVPSAPELAAVQEETSAAPAPAAPAPAPKKKGGMGLQKKRYSILEEQ